MTNYSHSQKLSMSLSCIKSLLKVIRQSRPIMVCQKKAPFSHQIVELTNLTCYPTRYTCQSYLLVWILGVTRRPVGRFNRLIRKKLHFWDALQVGGLKSCMKPLKNKLVPFGQFLSDFDELFFFFFSYSQAASI